MKRLLLIGFAACAFAVVPTLSASAMPRATPDTLVAGTATWDAAAADITMVGRMGGIAVDTRPGCRLDGNLRHKFNSSGALTTPRWHCFR